MRLAYADPPYIGQAKLYKKYRKQGHIAQEVDHAALIEQLQTYDGWALSCSSVSLHLILPMCPPKTRVGAFVRKGGGKAIPGIYPTYSWEPVLFQPPKRKPPRGILLDWQAGNIYYASARKRKSFTGEKPPEFSYWLFGILRAAAGDDFADIFPGSGAVTLAWQTWTRQMAMRSMNAAGAVIEAESLWAAS